MTTAYHAKYYAAELSRRFAADDAEKLTRALLNAQVDLNPHQVDAALFAFRSPLSMGAILADEVGLGKTIEAGLVISQKWAERKRHILIIVPSSLRKQWRQELADKFFIPATILESGLFNREERNGSRNSFRRADAVICSYQFARNKSDYLKGVPWDLVVIDEAHRLRNVYRPDNKIARELKDTLANYPKILMTATPLQNSLLELYGLVSFIDDYAFGDIKSFRAQYARLTDDDTYAELKQRLQPICKRTLRRQVQEYIRYTNRIPILEEFIPSKDEMVLYDMVSDYLRREELQALPAGQRSLMTLVLRKLLASSTFAIAGALDSLVRKLNAKLKANRQAALQAQEELADDFEELDDIAEEWTENGEDAPEVLSAEDIAAIGQEIADLSAFRDLAVSITENAKGKALLKALNVSFATAADLGAARKAILFTESRRTQNYLLDLLNKNGYEGKIVLFNGSNTDTISKAVYNDWKHRNKDTDKISGSRSADIRSALVDYFRDTAEIMIATEAAAEGVNLQFCSLVVNYDLPWNPQRIEQRIGRCHRYGQKHDVVVVNFLNKKNAADQRVYELLSEKFQLFSGVFGASDEVLGSIESGVDFEKRIVDIYQTCRRPEEIQAAFDALQAEMAGEIDENIKQTRQKLLENFDEDVHEKLRIHQRESQTNLDKHQKMLWQLARYALADCADFDHDGYSFMLTRNPFADLPDIPVGPYKMGRRVEDSHIFRPDHPLAQRIIARAADEELPPAQLVLDYSGYEGKISILEPLIGQSGILELHWLTVESLETQDYLVFAARSDDGRDLDEDLCRKLLQLTASVQPAAGLNGDLAPLVEQRQQERLAALKQRNLLFFEEQVLKLDGWSDDLKRTLETDIKDLDREIKQTKRQSTLAASLEEKLTHQKIIRQLEQTRTRKRRELFEQQDNIDRQRDELIAALEQRLKQKIQMDKLFSIRWKVQ